MTRDALDSFMRATSTFCSNLDSFGTTGKPSAAALLDECEALAEHKPEVREAIREMPSAAKRSFSFLYGLFETCKRNLEQIQEYPDLQSLRQRLATNNAQIKRTLSSFSMQLP